MKDIGCGIPEAHRASIFALVNRGEARARNTGTGVGLAIVKRAMERMGGSVRVESEVENGSEFILSLTCALVAAAESAS